MINVVYLNPKPGQNGRDRNSRRKNNERRRKNVLMKTKKYAHYNDRNKITDTNNKDTNTKKTKLQFV